MKYEINLNEFSIPHNVVMIEADKIKNMAEVQMEDQGTSEEQMQMALKMMDTFTSIPALMIIGLFSNTLFGVIIGSMLSIFLKKEKPTFD